MNQIIYKLLIISAMVLVGLSCEKEPKSNTGKATEDKPGAITVDGSNLVNEKGEKILLKSMAMGNEVWINPETPPWYHHNKDDFMLLSEAGFNAIRFYLNYKLFESDDNPYEYQEAGFTWIDNNISWAAEFGLYLILNMHVPQGGFQGFGTGNKLWENPENQERFIALWCEIARRYKDSSVVLGYDLLNEPVPPDSISQWENLARKTVGEIRKIDSQKPILIERTNYVLSNVDYNINGQMNFFLLDDKNIIYEFHFYEPENFCFQGFPGCEFEDSYSNYPDDFDKGIVADKINAYFEFAKTNEVPLFMGEFGLNRYAYDIKRGGLLWIKDVMRTAFDNNFHYNFHCYQGYYFGLFETETPVAPAPHDKLHEELFNLLSRINKMKDSTK